MLKNILDPASSIRSFYFNKNDDRVIFGDIREDEAHILCNGQKIHIKPDEVMGINWMIWGELVEAIPPAYTHYIGMQVKL